MSTSITGLHHVTAIASDPQRNLDFYTRILGLRFVKRTVNFDDPGTYHFYFGDDSGQPGTILTFFPWPGSPKGIRGAGETIATTFSIPLGSLDFWQARFAKFGLAYEERTVFGNIHLSIEDPDGMAIELVEHADADPVAAPRYSDVSPVEAIRGFFGVTIKELSLESTEDFIGLMGYQKLAQEGARTRYSLEGKARGRFLDVVVDKTAHQGEMGAGSVHHIAFRASDDGTQLDWQKKLGRTVSVTPIQDRTYFHSIYFHEPGGTLFEIATDNPGFLIDEPAESLGEQLRIPTWFEPQRGLIEARLPGIHLTKMIRETMSSTERTNSDGD